MHLAHGGPANGENFIILAAAYLLTRRLWFAIGIHAAWNFTQSGIFSVPTSGIPMHGLFVAELSGPPWLTGGAFGVEASAVAVALCTAFGLSLLALAARRGRFVVPFWRRAPAPVTARSRGEQRTLSGTPRLQSGWRPNLATNLSTTGGLAI